ncbi:helix-turn-helix transcriptional regulator [Deinococcus sp. KSM4-11]|uniref:helix-turn-helix domain-containing protein n=1 Tax=Deinococcus sp. KSM4-11 TaxID=2568654 RepID=UPI0010A32A0A|nr:helix-turn-helix transcriptional regulator [Deinococcus sp. KSM4-11]THF87187.1 helix-turn-helix transcriptional regulator [Deinococcus sp. KSM4-11]
MTLTPHEWLRSKRMGRYLRQSDIEQRTAILNGRIHKAQVSQLENGRLALTDLRPNQIDALCHVLDITPHEWRTHATSSDPAVRPGADL